MLACQSGHHYSVLMMLSLDAGLKCLMVKKNVVKHSSHSESRAKLDTGLNSFWIAPLCWDREAQDLLLLKQVRKRKDKETRFMDYIAQGLAPQFYRGQIESCVLLNKSLYTHNFIIVQGFQRHLISYSSFSLYLVFQRCQFWIKPNQFFSLILTQQRYFLSQYLMLCSINSLYSNSVIALFNQKK